MIERTRLIAHSHRAGARQKFIWTRAGAPLIRTERG